jgi:hypothetical protein
VGDDDELAGCPELLEHAQQAPEVGIVESRLDLVEDVERARRALKIAVSSATPRGAFAAGEEQSRSIFLPTGRTTASMPVVGGLSGSVRVMLPDPPGKRIGNTSPKAVFVSSNAARKIVCIRSSSSPMIVSRSLRVWTRSASCSVRRGAARARRTPRARAG